MSTNAKKSKAKNAFKSAKSTGEMIKLLKVLETCSEENELGLECWKLAEKFLTEDGDPEEVVSYGKRALSIFIYNDNANLPCFGTSHARGIHGSPLFIGHILHLLGSACFKLNRYHESLSYLNWSERNLAKLEDEDKNCPDRCVLHSLHATELELFGVKVAMGRLDEAASHMLKILGIKEKYMEDGSLGLGQACKDVYVAYLGDMQFKEALPFCLRASEIYSKHFGDDSLEVAQVRKNLGEIYHAIGEYEKALEQNQLAMRVLESEDHSSDDSCSMETQRACMLMHLGRNEEAVGLLKGMISRDDVVGSRRAMAYTHLAKAFWKLKNVADTKKYVKLARDILEKKDMKPMHVACGIAGLADVYEMMNDYGNAITVTRKALALTELPGKMVIRASERLFQLIYHSGKMINGIPYMKDAVEILTKKFGPEHYEVGYVHIKLAVAFEELDRLESAVTHFLIAKDIFDATIGPNHLESLKTGQQLSLTYASMGRFQRAIEFQKEVVERLEGMGQSEEAFPKEKFLKEAIGLLEKMKVCAREAKVIQNVVFQKMDR